LSYEILGYREIPGSLARKFIKEYIEKLREKGEQPPELLVMLSQNLDKVSKCSEDSAEQIYQQLLSMGFKEITASMIVDIRPMTMDELRMLLLFEPRVPDEDVLKKVLELLDQLCPVSL